MSDSESNSSISTEEEKKLYYELLSQRAKKSLKRHPEGLLGYDKEYRESFVNKVKGNPGLLKQFGARSWRDVLGKPLDEEERLRLGYDEQDTEEGEDGWETAEEADKPKNEDSKEERIKELEIIAINLRKDYERVRRENNGLKCDNLKLKNKIYEKRNEECASKKKYDYKCPCCSYKGLNIKRHVKKHHPDGIDKLQEQRVRKKERGGHCIKNRWCKLCQKYYAKIHQHLVVKHKFERNSQTYCHVLREAHKDFMKRKRGSLSSEDEEVEKRVQSSNKEKEKKTRCKGRKKSHQSQKRKANQPSSMTTKRKKGEDKEDKNNKEIESENSPEGADDDEDDGEDCRDDNGNVNDNRDNVMDDERDDNGRDGKNDDGRDDETVDDRNSDDGRDDGRDDDKNDGRDDGRDDEMDDDSDDERDDGRGNDEDDGTDIDGEETSEEDEKEDEDDSEEEQNKNQYINWNECSTSSDGSHIKMLKKFCKHLQHPDGGRKNERDAFQCTQRIHKMSLALSEKDDVNVNWIRKHSHIWENFVEKELNKKSLNKKGLSAKTLKVYLLTLERFCRFLIADRLVRPGKKEDVELLIKKLPLWRHSLRKDTRKQEEKKFDKDVDEMPEKEHLKLLLTHKTSVKVKDFLYNCADEESQDVSTKENTILARDYLIARVFIETMCRSGIVANLSIEDVLKAKEVDVNGQKQFSLAIHSHKTVEHKGTSYPSLSSELHRLILLFINECRPLLVSDDEKPNDQRRVFVSASGEPLESSSAGRRAVLFAKKVGIKKNFNPTLLRKTSSTVVASDDMKQQELHAQLLEHNLSTEIRFYRRLNKEKLQSQASVQNQERLGLGDILGHPNKDLEPEKVVSPEEVEENEKDSRKSTGRPESFSENALKELRDKFAQFLKLGICPSVKEVEKLAKTTRHLGKHTIKAIKNRVAYEIKQRKPELPTAELALENRVQDWLDGKTAPERESIASSSYAKSKWSADDTQTIATCFQSELHRPYLPRKSTIMDIFSSSSSLELKEIFLREDSEKWRKRCLEKVRTEWKKLHGKMPK